MSSGNGSLPKIGVVGVGRMGAGIALRLHDCGYPIAAVYDVYAPSAEAVAKETGATVCTELAKVTAHSDVIITVVTDDKAQRTIFADSGDSLLTNAGGKTFVNCATVSPAAHIDAIDRAERAGAHAVEALMASSIPQAREGTLYLMIGGDKAVYDRLQPMFEKMAKSLRYIGPKGSAAQVKALVNMVMNVNTAGLAEGLGIGDALGLDLTMLREVFSQTGANSRVLETDGVDMQNREHDVFFSGAHAAKDSHIAIDLAKSAGVEVPVAEASAAQFDKMVRLGIGELDKSGVAELTFKSRALTHH
ncbi:MAG: NAD(P)-dependent oxidoreductase [Vulcanimicrobiaceae bacterium]